MMVSKNGLLATFLLMLCSSMSAAVVKIKNAYNPNSYLELLIPDEEKIVTGVDIKKALYKKLFNKEPQKEDLKDFTIIFGGTKVEDEDPVADQALNGETVLFYSHPSMKENYQPYQSTERAAEQTGFVAYLVSLWNSI